MSQWLVRAMLDTGKRATLDCYRSYSKSELANIVPFLKRVATRSEEFASLDESERPSAFAVRRAEELLSNVVRWVSTIPEPAAILCINGGLQVTWKTENRNLRLFCAAEPHLKSYVYRSLTEDEGTSESDVTEAVDIFTLADGLNWLQAVS